MIAVFEAWVSRTESGIMALMDVYNDFAQDTSYDRQWRSVRVIRVVLSFKKCFRCHFLEMSVFLAEAFYEQPFCIAVWHFSLVISTSETLIVGLAN